MAGPFTPPFEGSWLPGLRWDGEMAIPLRELDMSETTSLGITQPIQGVKKPLRIGIPYPDTDVKIIDINTGEPVKQGETGEIWIKSPLVMSHYWHHQ